MNLIYHEIPIIAASLQPAENLLDLAHDIEQMLAIVHRGDGDTRVNDVRFLKMETMLDWVSKSEANYRWLQQLGAELCNRYAQIHVVRLGCEKNIKGVLASCPAGMKPLPWKWTQPPELYDEKL